MNVLLSRARDRGAMGILRTSLVWAICLLPVVSYAAPPAKASAWFVDSLIKVFPDTPATDSKVRPTIVSARNGHASLQVALSCVSACRVKVSVSAPRRRGSALDVRIFRVGYVRVTSHPPATPPDEIVRPEVGLYPDPLFPLEEAVTLEAGKTESVWISVFTPEAAQPGTYSGLVQVDDGQKRHKLPFDVEVFSATVPKEQKLWVTNWLWFEHEAIEKQYPKTKTAPDRYWTVLENTARTLAAYKQNVALVPVRTLAKAQLVGDSIRYDFSDFDHWVEIFDRAGLARMIEGGHLSGRLGGGYDAPYVVATDLIEGGQLVRKELPAADPRAEQNLRVFLQQLRAHLEQKGWLSRYVQHIHDEPHGPEMPIYKRFVQIVNEEMPGVPTIDAISLKEDISSQEKTTIWVPLLSTFDDKLETIAEHKTKGGQGWYYICLYPAGRYLNRFVDFPLLKVRLLPWVNFRYGLTGYLHWGGNYWTDKPFEDLQPNWGGDTYLPAGDDSIVYPDPAHDGVFVSTRLEIMREGIEDYGLLLSAANHAPAEAESLGKTVIPNFTDYVRDVSRFRQYQRELLTLASKADH